MEAASVGRRVVAVLVATVVVAAGGLLFSGFWVSRGSGDPLKCPVAVDAMQDPTRMVYERGDLAPADRMECVASARNRVRMAVLLLASSAVGGGLGLVVFRDRERGRSVDRVEDGSSSGGVAV